MNIVHKKSRGRPPKSTDGREADRQALVDAAVALMEEGGVAAFNARAVAERAGTAVGSVYGQFESLEALRLEANGVTLRRLGAALRAGLSSCAGRSMEERLSCLAEAYLSFAAEHHNSWSALFERRTIDAPPALVADIADLFAILEGVLRDGRLAEEDVTLMAKSLWASVHGMVFLGDAGGLGPVAPGQVPAMVRALVRTVVRGLTQGG